MVLVAGCTSQTKHKWLTFFFDGVPSPQGAPLSSRPDHLQTEDANWPPMWRTPPALAARSAVHQPVDSQPIVHPPYADRQCEACHASNFSQRLKGEVSAICISCHKMFLVKAKFSHAPIEDGQCTLCHEPHQAKEKFLLVKNSRELCFDCHDPEYISQIKPCAESEASTCTACHDPHQENRRFLLHGLVKHHSSTRSATPEK